jgi:hypothetical protein
MWQVGHLGEDYDKWVHQPIMGKEGPRFFHSSILEVPTLPYPTYIKFSSFMSICIKIDYFGFTRLKRLVSGIVFRGFWFSTNNVVSKLITLLRFVLLEQVFTRTAWWVIPIIWVPIASCFIYNSFRLGLPVPHLPLFVLLGIFVWTLTEYLLHRFLFHVQTKSYWGNTLHYLLHGCHHKHPMDSLRLVFPPAGAALIAYMVYPFLHFSFVHSK